LDTEKTQDEFRHSQSLEQQAQAAALDRAARAAGLRRSHRATGAAENPQLEGAGPPPQMGTAAPVQSPQRAFRAHIEKWIREVVDQALPIMRLVGWVLGAIVVVSIGLTSYDSLDSSGWITHNHDTPVWISGDWIVGEYRDCGMLTKTQLTGSVRSQEVLAELPRLLCGREWDNAGLFEFENATTGLSEATKSALWYGGDWSALDGYFHVLPVRYYGRIDRPDTVSDSWRCQRLSESLECKAIN